MAGNPILAQRLNELFATRLHPQLNRPFTDREVAGWLTAHGCPVSATGVWNLRKGETTDPRISTVQALALFFSSVTPGVPVTAGYLMGEDDQPDADLQKLVIALSDAGVRHVALNAAELSPRSVEVLLELAEQLKQLESRDT